MPASKPSSPGPFEAKISELTREDMVARAWALAPVLHERAAETERLGRIHPDTVQDFHESRLWRIHQPKRYGGLELDFTLYIDIGEALGRGCGSTAWVWANLACHDWMLGMFNVKAQDEVWHENPNALIGSAVVYPCGKAERVDGGYRLSGHWPFSSGIAPSDWILLGAMTPEPETGKGEGGAPAPRIFIIRKSDIEELETWDVSGLVGTGSQDVACKDVFVADHMTLALKDARGGATPGSEVNDHPIYRMPMLGVFPHIIAGPILGMARGAYEDYLDTIRSKLATYNQSKLAEHTNLQMRIAEAGVKIDAARLLLRDNCEEATAVILETGTCTEAQKTRWRRDSAFAANLCAEAVDVIYAAAGGGANYRKNPLQRHFRDVHAGLSHIGLSWDANAPEYARSQLGLPIGNPNL
jgi:3-hydroxy-9,10-secoandrosta-1,3,5(10)-triene-9,17-dione monooxygenase